MRFSPESAAGGPCAGSLESDPARAKCLAMRPVAPPDIKPRQRNRRVHEEARLRAEHASGQPGGSVETGIQQASLGYLRAIGGTDYKQLHVIECNVKSDCKPQCARPDYRVGHHEAE